MTQRSLHLSESIADEGELTAVSDGYLASNAHEAAMQGLTRGVRDGAGLLVLTGDSGSGKTTLLKRFAAEMQGIVEPVLCGARGLELAQVVNFACSELELTHTRPTPRSELDALRDHLDDSGRRPLALLIDDADRLQGLALDQLLGLRRGVHRSRPDVHLVLSGARGLQARLKREHGDDALVREAIFVRVGRLSEVEAAAFVEQVAPRRVSAPPAELDATVVSRLVAQAAGNPRTLVELYAAALRAPAEAGRASRQPSGDPEPAVARPPALDAGGRCAPIGSVSELRAVSSPPADAPRPAAVLTRWRQRWEGIAPPAWLLPSVASAAVAAAVVVVLLRDGTPVTAERPSPSFASPSAPRPDARAPTEPAPVGPAADTVMPPSTDRASAAAPAIDASAPAAGPPSAPPAVAAAPISAPAAATARNAPPDIAPPARPPQTASASSVAPAPGVVVPPDTAPVALAPADPPASAARRQPGEPAPVESRRAVPARPAPQPRVRTAAPTSRAAAAPSRPSADAQAEAHLARARDALARNALTTPEGDNAVRWSRAALAVDPGNGAAIDVLRDVVNRYLRWSNRALEDDQLDEASRFLDKARGLSRHATRDQLAAADVIEDRIALQRRRLARSGPKYHIAAPRWLRDIETWVEDLPLPRDSR